MASGPNSDDVALRSRLCHIGRRSLPSLPRQKNTMKTSFALVALVVLTGNALAQNAVQPKKLVLMAGKPSHPPRMHEFNAGVQLLAKCLSSVPSVKTEIILSGWPKDE